MSEAKPSEEVSAVLESGLPASNELEAVMARDPVNVAEHIVTLLGSRMLEASGVQVTLDRHQVRALRLLAATDADGPQPMTTIMGNGFMPASVSERSRQSAAYKAMTTLSGIYVANNTTLLSQEKVLGRVMYSIGNSVGFVDHPDRTDYGISKPNIREQIVLGEMPRSKALSTVDDKTRVQRSQRSPRASVSKSKTTELATDEGIDIYLAAIRNFELLKPDEEIDRARKIEAGKLAASKRRAIEDSGFIIDPQLDAELMQQETSGRQARDRLLEANLPRVVFYAKQYNSDGMSLTDLIQEGNIGLMHAVERYNPAVGNFGAYVKKCIVGYIIRAIYNQSRVIRLPLNVSDQLTSLGRAERSLQQKFGRIPSPDQLSKETGLTVERIITIRRDTRRPASLDRKYDFNDGDGDTFTLGDVVASNYATADDSSSDEMPTLVHESIAALPSLHRDVVTRHYGLFDGEVWTYERISKSTGYSRNKISRIAQEALGYLSEDIRKQDA